MIVVIDCGIGNVGSIVNMLHKCGAEVRSTSDENDIECADKLIMPGVGSFDYGMQALRGNNLIPVLESMVIERKTPILGICLGMQLLTERSEEGVESGLGWIDATTVRFKFDQHDERLKIPHMGWNSVALAPGADSGFGLDTSSRFYFVHSYHVVCRNSEDVLATATYGYQFVAAVKKENIIGVQFHPEKSHRYGLNFLDHFARL